MIEAGDAALIPTTGGAPSGDVIGKEIAIDVAKEQPVRWDFLVPQDSVDWAHRKAESAIDAFLRLDVEHPSPLIDAIDRTGDRAGSILRIDAGFGNYVSHDLRLMPL